jgi:hypothetical protein
MREIRQLNAIYSIGGPKVWAVLCLLLAVLVFYLSFKGLREDFRR